VMTAGIGAFIVAMIAAGRTSVGQDGATPRERELIAVLRSDSPAADKAITCKWLAIHGSRDAVPDLARLLADEQLASWARIALEAIPGPESDEALRQAIPSLNGRLLVGVINSLGVRRGAGSTAALAARLGDADPDVASSAAAALGKIGTADAAAALKPLLATAPDGVRSAVAEGCVLCAERFLSDGNAADAIALYDQVRGADVHRARILDATRGAILARKQDGIPMLVELLSSEDKGLFQIALVTAREIPGGALDKALAAALPKIDPDRGALVIHAMADRKGTVELSAIIEAAKGGAPPVRRAAAKALGRVGDAAAVPTLLEMAVDADPAIQETARVALAELPDPEIDQALVGRLAASKGPTFLLLIDLIGRRRIAATDALIPVLENRDASIRAAALRALGETVRAKDLNVLIGQVVSPKHADDAAAARLALKTAAVRMPDPDSSATEIARAMKGAPIDVQSELLEILGAMGGSAALDALATAARGSNPQLQDVSTRLLGEWMTADAAPVLLDLVKTAPGEKYQVRAMRGYIRIARQFVIPDADRAAMCRSALAASRQTAERKLVLEVLRRYPTTEMLKIAVDAMDDGELKDEATQAALVIAQKLGAEAPEVRDLLAKARIERVKLEIIKAEYGSGSTYRDVTDIVRRHAGDLPLIVLASANYNKEFGGDPTPGVAKQLKIRYQMQGKAGEAAFGENALIVLPVPK